MRLNFLVPSSRIPVGGIAILYEFGQALAARGHAVRLMHHDLFGSDCVTSEREIDWFDFDGSTELLFYPHPPVDLDTLPHADIFLGGPLDGTHPELGLPVTFVQGWNMYPSEQEVANYRKPCPKLCVASWLVRVGRELGVHEAELIHTPLGLDHRVFRSPRPISQRPPQVTYCHNEHRKKGSALARDTLEIVREAHPDVALRSFGTQRPEWELPDWLDFEVLPDTETLVDDLYGNSRVFVCASEVEGFGLTSLEAMATGAALVTTANGGSEDYADHERTALVADAHEPEVLAELVGRLLDDEAECAALADAGMAKASEFTWKGAAAHMEAVFEAYLADPTAYGRPA